MKYISLLRGINVSGQKSVKMNDLRVLYENLGLRNVITYIQSGNVIFDATGNIASLADKIEKAIQKKYKFHVPVEIRTRQEFLSIIKNCPLKFLDLDANGAKVLVVFLSDFPSKDHISNIMQHVAESEKLIFNNREAYLYCPNGHGKSKLSNKFLEQKLKIRATTRNWKTVVKLLELSAD